MITKSRISSFLKAPAVQEFIHVLIPKSKRGKIAALSIYGSILMLTAVMFGISRWYAAQHQNTPFSYGVTFTPDYARQLGVEPQETLQAILTDLQPDRLRLTSYWKSIEPEPGVYDFEELDWQFAMAEKAGVDVLLAVGLRQPRWPECHEPSWIDTSQTRENWQPQLEAYMSAVIDRYKNSPALHSYQLENEYFLEAFGHCKNFERQRLIEEFDLVRSLDPNTPITISRSNNGTVSWPVGDPKPDMVGAAIYKRVWDGKSKRYFEYPFPPWFYGFLAGATKITYGRDSFIHELQTEAWLPSGFAMKDASTEELYKSMSPEIFEDRIKYAKDTGIRTIDMWGPEWWYHMKTQRNAPEIWLHAKKVMAEEN